MRHRMSWQLVATVEREERRRRRRMDCVRMLTAVEAERRDCLDSNGEVFVDR